MMRCQNHVRKNENLKMEVACYEATYVGYPEGCGMEVAPSMTKGKTNSSQMRNMYV